MTCLRYFEAGKNSIDKEAIHGLLEGFQAFREKYVHAYVEASSRALG